MKNSMKITMALAFSAFIATGLKAETLNIQVGNVNYMIDASQAGVMEYTGGTSLTVQGKVFKLADISTMNVVDDSFDDNTVEIVYAGTSANVTIAGNVAMYVDAVIDGANVTINQSDAVGDKTCGEITYILKGESDNGSFLMNGSYKATIELQGVTLTNPKGAAIDIENGKRIELSSKNNTVNTLVDGSDGKQKAALYCKGHLELKGKGVLNVTGNTGHAIAAKEYIEMKNVTVNIDKAVKDGVNCTQYFLMESGELNIDGVDGDGIQVDYKDSTNREEEDTGTITIAGGKLNINISGTAAKGLKAEGDFVMQDGEVTIFSSSPGEWDSDKLKTKASSCVGADADVYVNGGSMTLTATGGGGKGISCDGTFLMNGGDLNITTSGGALVYNGGVLSQNYTGNLDRIASDYKSSPKGIKADTNVQINDGTIYIKTTGNNGEGIESKNTLTIEGGNITVRAKDDAINSSSHMYINGGEINVIATSNDGLDANGNIYINGGVIRSFGATSPECGIDANEEQGYTVIITGGYLLAVGGNNSVPSSSSGSQQPYVTVSNASVTGGDKVSIATGSDTLYTFTVPEDYSTSSSGNGPGGGNGGWGPGGGSARGLQIMISTPGMTTNTTYTVTSGSNSYTGTSRVTGSGNNRPW